FPDLPSVLADATQLRQVVMNLITNASEAIGELSGSVTLSTGVMDCDVAYLKGAVDYSNNAVGPGQYVYLEVSDTGCGMDAETVPRIFDPFFTTKFMGRGLGLAAVMGIVRGHKGAIRISSEPGKGTTFRVLFPASGAAVPAVQSEPAVVPGRSTGTVLVVDDEETIRKLAQRMLEYSGCSVLLAGGGREAI